ncbi:UDP-N-acetylmuramyl-tripeptide synthetase [Leuconostocaceae bacterium ESL0958]|nr:UDP-N-acetylmuramyl-tripeptide synthetase [Leuconostocaceae bacterium ESL0958]
MQLSSQEVTHLLTDHDLLLQAPEEQLTFKMLHYDSRQVMDQTLFVVKGRFKAAYLAQTEGISALVSEKPIDDRYPTWLVRDSQKALAVLSAAYFGYPQEALWIGAVTGTKGKTTTAYFAHAILQASTGGHCALFSTVDRIVGPKAADRKKSDLTTPESYELYHDMRRAVDNGMTHLVMEVSSQAYLKERVYGLDFNVGIFLNISPDHIGENEHPTFADYLAHKEMLLDHSDQVILNADMDYYAEVAAHAKLHHSQILTYSQRAGQGTVHLLRQKSALHDSRFALQTDAPTLAAVNASFRLNVPGDFNEENAAAALMLTALAGAKQQAMVIGLDQVTIPGRMMSLPIPEHGVAFVDYAHNYASLLALLSFAKKQSPDGQVLVVLGAPGNKGISRRADFARVLSEQADQVFLTADDPQYEDPAAIAHEIADQMTNPAVQCHFEMDRPTAIAMAVQTAGPKDLVIVAGKGEDPYQKIDGEDVPYAGDYALVKDLQEHFQKQEADPC